MNDAQWLAEKIKVAGRAKSKCAGKGGYGGVCFRKACSTLNAVWYNRETDKHYCEECAEKINNSWAYTVLQHNKTNEPFKLNAHPLCSKSAATL